MGFWDRNVSGRVWLTAPIRGKVWENGEGISERKVLK